MLLPLVRRSLLRRCALGLAALLLWPLGAGAAALEVDSAASSITRGSDPPAALSGDLTVVVDQQPSGNSPLALTGLAISGGGLDIALQPIANPGLGVVNDAGSFLIPTLFLTIDDGGTPFDLALPDITGLLLGPGSGCAFDTCLESSFEIDTPGGQIAVSLVAIPEPSTGLLVAFGCVLLAVRGRRTTR